MSELKGLKRLREPQVESESPPPPPPHGPRQELPLAGPDSALPRPPAKVAEIDCSPDSNQNPSLAFRCSLPPHSHALAFATYGDYEAHYYKFHVHRCLECHKNFPSEHLLNVHIEEFHDPLARVKRDKGEHTYSCFVEGCPRKCLTHQKRRMHLIDKHMYPKNFFFAITKHGVDGRRSLLVEPYHHPNRSMDKVRQSEEHDSAEPANHPADELVLASSSSDAQGQERASHDADMAGLTGAMSALQFVPSSVRFGHRGARFAPR